MQKKRIAKQIVVSNLLLVLFFITALSVPAQEVSEQASWVLLEQGKKAFRVNEFGPALRYFREAVEKEGAYPEAEYWIGKIFEKEQEFDVAVRQYKKALSMTNLLYIPEQKYTIRYNLAALYGKMDKNKQYEEVLQQITAEDELFSAPENEPFRQAVYKNMVEHGTDKLLVLYRLESDFSLEALERLGIFYFKSGRYRKATNHLLFSVVTIFSKCIDEIRRKDPDYTFEETEECLRRIMEEDRLREYVTKTDLFMNMYYLGASLAGEGYLERAESLWRLVAERSNNSNWRNEAQAQLSSPVIEQ